MRFYGSKLKRTAKWVLTYIAVGAVLAFFIFPVLWELLASFKPPAEVISSEPHFLFKPTLESWRSIFTSGIFHNFKNSLIVVGGSTLLATFFGSLAGYALARGKLRSRKVIAMEMLTLRMLPPIAMIIPIFVLFQKMHLHNTYLGLILMYTTANLPLSVWLMLGYFGGVPEEIGEAAMVDGANKWVQFRAITFPLTKIQLVIVLLTITLWTLQDAETVYALTEGGPGYSTEVMAVRLFKESFINFDLNAGATMGMLLLLVGLVFMILYTRLID